MKKFTPKFKTILAFLCIFFFFDKGFAQVNKTNHRVNIDYKKFIFGFAFKGKNPVWSQDICKPLNYNLLKPIACKKAIDNIGNKSIICNLPDKQSKLLAYLNIDDCKVDLQMSTEGDNP